MSATARLDCLRRSDMLIKFKVAGADKSVWINPDQVSGVLATSAEITTVYLAENIEQRIEAHPEAVAKDIEEAQGRVARDPRRSS